MTKYPDRENEFYVEITSQEWDRFPLEAKTLLLYRLRQLQSEDLQELVEALGPVIEHEEKETEIDFHKTFQKRYGENISWPV